MRVFFAVLGLFTFIGLASKSAAETNIDEVFAACKTTVNVEDQQLCKSAIGDYVGEKRSMGRRAEQLMRQLARAAK